MDQETSKTISSWADLVSLVLVAVSMLLGGLSPSRPVWGHSNTRLFLLFCVLFTSFVWTVFCVLQEDIHRESGPREFLAANVIYCGRWLYLWLRMHWPNSRESKLYQVARALRHVHMLRVGKCTEDSPTDPARVRGVREVVLRRGAKAPSRNAKYWRGIKEVEEFHEDVGVYEIFLVEKELHRERLDLFGTIEFMDADAAAMDKAYKQFYDVVMRAVIYRKPTDEERDNAEDWDTADASERDDDQEQDDAERRAAEGQARRVEVVFQPFMRQWRGLPVEGLARHVGADDPRMIGRVARRIAADACVYINDVDNEYEFRTEKQVQALNECLRRTAASVFPGGLREGARDRKSGLICAEENV